MLLWLFLYVRTGPKGVINDWRKFKLDSVDQTIPQNKRELLRQMSSHREDDKERLNRKVDGNTHWIAHWVKHTIFYFIEYKTDPTIIAQLFATKNKKICTNRRINHSLGNLYKAKVTNIYKRHWHRDAHKQKHTVHTATIYCGLPWPRTLFVRCLIRKQAKQ